MLKKLYAGLLFAIVALAAAPEAFPSTEVKLAWVETRQRCGLSSVIFSISGAVVGGLNR